MEFCIRFCQSRPADMGENHMLAVVRLRLFCMRILERINIITEFGDALSSTRIISDLFNFRDIQIFLVI